MRIEGSACALQDRDRVFAARDPLLGERDRLVLRGGAPGGGQSRPRADARHADARSLRGGLHDQRQPERSSASVQVGRGAQHHELGVGTPDRRGQALGAQLVHADSAEPSTPLPV